MADFASQTPFAVDESLTNVKIHNLFDNSVVNNFVRADFNNASSPIHIATTAPTTGPVPIAGHAWYDSTDGLLRIYDGTDWVPWARGWVYTNNSGGSLSAGDVVVLDTANASSVTTTTTANDADAFGVVLIGGADTAKVIISTEGRVSVVNVTGATAIGDYLSTSTTAGSAVPSSTADNGIFARALTSTAGAGTVVAQIGGASLSGSSIGTRWLVNDEVSFTRSTTSPTGTQVVAHSLGVLPKQIHMIGFLSTKTWALSQGASVIVGGSISDQHVSCIGGGRTSGIQTATDIAVASENNLNYMIASLTAITTTNFTITWAEVGSITGGLTFGASAVLMA